MNKYFEQKKIGLIEEENNDIIIISKGKQKENISISNNEVDNLLYEIITVFGKKIYKSSITDSIVGQFNNNSLTIIKLKLVDKLILARELLRHLKTNARETSDLTLMGLSKVSGTLRIGKTLKPNMILFYESVTGRYKHIIFEVPNGI